MISPKNENFIFFRYFMRENACYPPGDINIPNTLDFYFQVIIPQLYRAANLATHVTTYEIPLKTFVKFVGFCFSDFDGAPR